MNGLFPGDLAAHGLLILASLQKLSSSSSSQGMIPVSSGPLLGNTSLVSAALRQSVHAANSQVKRMKHNIDSSTIYRVPHFVSQLFKNTVAPAMNAAPSTLTWSASSSSSAAATSTSSSAAAASDSNSISLAFNNSIAEVMALAAEANANKTASAKEKDLLAATMAAASAAALGLQQPATAAKVPDVTITSKAKSKQSSAGGVAGQNFIKDLPIYLDSEM